MYFQWLMGFGLLSFFLAVIVGKKTSPIFGTGVFYALLSGLYIVLCPNNRYAYDPTLQMYLSHLCMFSLISILFMSIFIMNGSLKIGSSLALFAILDSIYVIYGHLYMNGEILGGFLPVAGMNGVLIALCLAFLEFHSLFHLAMWALCLIAIILCHASNPFGVLAMVLAGRALHHSRTFFDAVCAFVAVIVIGVQFHSHLFHDSSRFEGYRIFMHQWWIQADHWFGTGPGSFLLLGPMTQKAHHFMFNGVRGDLWEWMHSDWLQTLFEYGYVGFGLSLLIGVDIAHRLWKKDDGKMFGLFLGGCGAGLFDFPLRYFPTAILISLAARSAYSKETSCQVSRV